MIEELSIYLHIIHNNYVENEVRSNDKVFNDFSVHQLKLPTVFVYPFLIGPLYELVI